MEKRGQRAGSKKIPHSKALLKLKSQFRNYPYKYIKKNFSKTVVLMLIVSKFSKHLVLFGLKKMAILEPFRRAVFSVIDYTCFWKVKSSSRYFRGGKTLFILIKTGRLKTLWLD